MRRTDLLYPTTAIALATMLVVGAILLLPTMSQCRASDEGVAACLHDKLIEADLLPAQQGSATGATIASPALAAAPTELQAASGEMAAKPTMALVTEESPVSLQVAPGTIEAGATVSGARDAEQVALTAGARVAAGGSVESSSDITGSITLAPASGSLTTRLAALPPPAPATGALNASSVLIAARATPTEPAMPVPAPVELQPGEAGIATLTAAAEEPDGAVVAAADLSPEPVAQAPSTEPVPEPAAPPAPEPVPAPEPNPPETEPFEFIGSPSVTLMPPPTGGANASIITLQLGG
ncbi:MAG: hypothetical protein ABL879_17130 [Devosia sp.]